MLLVQSSHIYGQDLETKGPQKRPVSLLRATRHLVKLSAEDLAERAKVGIATVRRAESEGGPKTSAVVLNALRLALEAAGVEFLATNDGGPGVRLKERKS